MNAVVLLGYTIGRYAFGITTVSPVQEVLPCSNDADVNSVKANYGIYFIHRPNASEASTGYA